MIAAHLEAMYPTHNIELVVIQAEDAYDVSLVSRSRAYGASSEVSAFQPSSSSVTVDLSKPGKSSLVRWVDDGVTDARSQSCPSPHPRPLPNPPSSPSHHFCKRCPPPPILTCSTISSLPSSTSQALIFRTLRKCYSARHPLDKHRISLRAQRSGTDGVSLSSCKAFMCYRKQLAPKQREWMPPIRYLLREHRHPFPAISTTSPVSSRSANR